MFSCFSEMAPLQLKLKYAFRIYGTFLWLFYFHCICLFFTNLQFRLWFGRSLGARRFEQNVAKFDARRIIRWGSRVHHWKGGGVFSKFLTFFFLISKNSSLKFVSSFHILLEIIDTLWSMKNLGKSKSVSKRDPQNFQQKRFFILKEINF